MGITEADIRARSIVRAAKAKHQAQQKGRESTQGGTQSVLKGLVPLLAARIESDLAVKRVGRRLAALSSIRRLGCAKTAAFITVRTLLDTLSRGATFPMAATTIGARVEDETRFREWSRAKPGLFRAIDKRIKSEPHGMDYRYLHRILVHALNRADADVPEWQGYGLKKQAIIGAYLIVRFMETTGLVELQRKPKGRNRSINVVVATEELLDLISSADARLIETLPWFLPMTDKPKPWTCLTDGGYFTYQRELVKLRDATQTSKAKHRQRLQAAHDAGKLAPVYKAVNALQDTAWKVNEDVLVTLEELWKTEEELPGVPRRSPIPIPPRPEDFPLRGEELTSLQQDVLRVWKQSARAAHDANFERKLKLLGSYQIKAVATQLRDEAHFYFPHELDWRGRAYPMPLLLQPQGCDLARGLLTFAEGKPLGPDGVNWLARHGANCWGAGLDKAPFEEREAWVDNYCTEIMEVSEDPVTNRWWMEAEEPWQFLAFCFEWTGVQREERPWEFVSHLPVAMDGTCNGLQHFSAMLRDPVGAKATNLSPSDRPQDIYAEVARVVEAKVRQDTGSKLAREWLQSGLLGRSVVKRQVMTLPYGATQLGMRDQLRMHLRKLPQPLPFEDGIGNDATNYLTPIIWESISEVVVAAVEAMDWLRGVARLAAEAGSSLEWTTPVGFPVVQHYVRTTKHQVKTALLGGLKFVLRYETPNLDKRKQAAGISPNLVHSLDAAHMMRTINTMPGRSWAMVHDSYGTHAADCSALAEALRHTFVVMYELNDPLVELRQGMRGAVRAELPPVPAPGSFELGQVLESPYFFA